MRRNLKELLHRFGYNLSRVPANRFDATADTLLLLRSLGYTPSVIVDAGANAGEWTRMAHRMFPNAMYHLIEPQPGFHAELRSLAQQIKGQLHPVAVTEPGVTSVHIAGVGTTGAAVCSPAERGDSIPVPANTLDGLVEVRVNDRALLKLDLETHELIALRGAEKLLSAVEVALTEVSFYHPAAPLFFDMMVYLHGHGFRLCRPFRACLASSPA